MDILSLFEELLNGLFEAEDIFYNNPKDFFKLETTVKTTTDAFAAKFLGNILSRMNEQIYKSNWREGKFNAQRTDRRTLISSVGDICFDCTYYKNSDKDSEKKYTYLLEDVLGLERHERFTEAAEVAILTEALKTSYEEASKAIPSKSKITKTTVMNKVHAIAEKVPYEPPAQKKECKYLFIEADEDHVAEQHGRWGDKKDNKGFISRLVYVYEYKRESPKCSGRKELVNTFYFGGLYPEIRGVERLWNEVYDYIISTYDIDSIDHIFISGDGAAWIKSGRDYIYKSLFCLDKFHLVKYINAAANQMLDEKDIAKSELYRLLYKKNRKDFKAYTDKMKASAGNTKPVEDLQGYVLNNWAAAMRTMHNKVVKGCSAEGHVSTVLSDRLSSRPKGWSRTGADRMTVMRCYERNYGRDKIIDLVRLSRQEKRLKRTGTDDIPVKELTISRITADHYDQARSYIERIQAHMPGITSRKSAAIKFQLRLL